jgi:signal transduction histidine kinase
MPENKVNIIISVIAISILILLLMVVIIMIFRIFLKRKNKLLQEKRLMTIQFEQTLLQSQLEIQEQTFKYISGELHDNINQILSLVRINLNTLTCPEAKKIDEMDDLLGKAITDLRQLSHSLDAEHIRNMGWTEPVIRILKNLESSGKYQVQINLEKDLPAIESEKGIILFRIIQESINNIIKHSDASVITFGAVRKNGHLTIHIHDNGKGFDTRGAFNGVGLRNLSNRALMINATLEIDSSPGKGTNVIIIFNP